jgi:hypothetical protein
MKKADEKTLIRIKELHKLSKTIWPINRNDAYNINGLKSIIEDYANTGKYSSKTLNAIEKTINERLVWAKEEKEELKKLPKKYDLIFVDKKGVKWTAENLKELVNACYKKKEFNEAFDHYF